MSESWPRCARPSLRLILNRTTKPETTGASSVRKDALLDNGDIPHRKVGRHRRVRFVDVMEYKQRTGVARSQALDELAAQAQELDMGY